MTKIADPHKNGKAPVHSGAIGRFPRALRAVAVISEYGCARRHCPTHDMTYTAMDERIYRDAFARHQVDEEVYGAYDAPHGPDDDGLQYSKMLHAAHAAWNALARLETMLVEGYPLALTPELQATMNRMGTKNPVDALLMAAKEGPTEVMYDGWDAMERRARLNTPWPEADEDEYLTEADEDEYLTEADEDEYLTEAGKAMVEALRRSGRTVVRDPLAERRAVDEARAIAESLNEILDDLSYRDPDDEMPGRLVPRHGVRRSRPGTL